jgi:hypothetical protein
MPIAIAFEDRRGSIAERARTITAMLDHELDMQGSPIPHRHTMLCMSRFKLEREAFLSPQMVPF